MKDKLKNWIKKNEIIMKILTPFLSKNKILKNIYKTDYERQVLISYINNPFLKKHKIGGHSGEKEVKIITEIFKEFKYNIDIVNYQLDKKISLKKYDLIFGFGNIYEKSFFDKEFKGKRIFYATGAEQEFQANAEINRIKEFNKRKNAKLLPKRIAPNYWPLSYYLSDGIIVIGNEWTKSTWRRIYDGPILTQVGTNIKITELNVKKKNKEFVFIGSLGNVHKGLDICIDIFQKLNSEYILNIFSVYEEEFFYVYGELPQNIKFHGFKNPNSEYFKTVLEKCNFIIAPSCSEGQMTSLLLGIINGLYPLATKETGVTLPDECYLKELNEKYLEEKIVRFYSMPNEVLDLKTKELSEEFWKNHSLENFKNNFFENFKILEKTIKIGEKI